MRLAVSWPKQASRRLDGRMADERPRTGSRFPRRSGDWTRDEVAQALVSERDLLIARLPQELSVARGMTRDQRELVVDESIDFLVTEYVHPIHDREHLDRAFWTAAGIRVRRMHEGRGATVRGGWKRVDFDSLEIAGADVDPAAAAVHKLEVGVLLEFAATLTETQREVLVRKYGGEREIGRRVIARQLGVQPFEVRRAERAIAKKLTAFVAIVSAGALCESHDDAIAGLAAGKIDGASAAAARIHLEHCAACRVGYVELARSLRTGALQHRIAELLPLTITAEEASRHRGAPWDAWSDWAGRIFGSEATPTGIQVAAGARGLGAAAAMKLASLCIGGAVVLGGASYCVTTILDQDPPLSKSRPAPSPQEPRTAAQGPAEMIRPSAGAKVFKVKTRRAPKRARSSTSTSRRETEHERATAISPAVTTSSGAPVDEFGPGPETTAPTPPAAAPSTGGPEFP